MIVVTVARKPLSEGTVASNVLEHGTGALNINACRIGGDERRINNYQSAERQGCIARPGDAGHAGRAYETRFTVAGRWPANLILGHLDGCEQEGVTLQGSGRYVPHDGVSRTSEMMSPEKGWNANGMSNSVKNAPNSYGVEAVPAWKCATGCPVAEPDSLGDRKSSYPGKPDLAQSYAVTEVNRTRGVSLALGIGAVAGLAYADSGTASRFFKQVGGRR